MRSSEVLPCDSVLSIIHMPLLGWFQLHISLYHHLLKAMQLHYTHEIDVYVFVELHLPHVASAQSFLNSAEYVALWR